MTRQHGLELAKRYQLDGIMIGRGIFQDPFVFAGHSPWKAYTPEQRIGLYKQHVKLFAGTWQHNERPIHTLNKFCKIYINGFDGAKELREQLMSAGSTDELLALLD
jgi:tRNA-dihydrouridine synthase